MTPRRTSAASLVRLLADWRGRGGGPAYRQLEDALRLLILDGRLPLEVVLPGERELAQALEVSRITVSTALARLTDAGFLERRQGAGARTRLPNGPAVRSAYGPMTHDNPAGLIDFSSAALAAGEVVHRAYAAALTALPAYLPGHGYEQVGLLELREAIAARYSRRGLATTADQILVTNGAQHGLALILRLLCGPGDGVIIDHPTYPHAIDALERGGLRPIPVGVPAGGWDVEGLTGALRQRQPRAAYVLADFQNPTGRWMPPDQRAALARAAAEVQSTVIFDETLADIWLGGPVDPYGFDEPEGAVVRLGSTGKSFWGGLRVGWVRADIRTIVALARSRPAMDLGTPVLEQLAVVDLLANEDDALDVRRAMLRARRDLLVRLVRERLPDWRVEPPPGGLSLWAELPAPVSSPLAAAAEAEGLAVAAGPRFGVDGAFERFVRLPFAQPPEVLETAVDRLARAYARLRPGAAARLWPGATVF